jgi:diguanylate cyclase (GGDEF)-like protein
MPLGPEDDSTVESVVPPGPLLRREDISLLILTGPAAGQYHKLPYEGGLIGRALDVDVTIPDPGVSRHHARILREEKNVFVIADLDSNYGVWIEGERARTQPLQDGDRVQLSADTLIRVRYQDTKETEILDRIQDAVRRDALTGVANRRYLIERLDQELAYARRHNASFTVLMIDVDFFKRINDTRGHQIGDELLRAVGRSLHQAVRVEDLVARYGGDEFMVFARGYDDTEGAHFADRLVRSIRDRPIHIGEDNYSVTLSIGVASYHRGDPDSLMQLITRADAALYQAKARGRNQVAVWNADESSKPTRPAT